MGSRAAVLCTLLLTLIAAAPAAAQLPDLVADPVERPLLDTYSDGSGSRLLLRFDGFVHNAGIGALEVTGSNRSAQEMRTVVQRVYDGGGSSTTTALPDARLLFETSDGHRHWHLRNAARYSLVDAAGTEVTAAPKVGFCLLDNARLEPHGSTIPEYDQNCAQDAPSAASVSMGVSAGWRDIYSRTLAFQWVDVSEVQPGSYFIRSEVDPDGLVHESEETNAPADEEYVLPGWVAEAIAASGLQEGTPNTITLGAAAHGRAGERRYRIESQPLHGTLDQPAGEWFSGASVTYRPRPGYRGPDSFTFSARTAGSQFPRHPAIASATLDVSQDGESVGLSGAPAQLATGATAQLGAIVANGPPGVSWSIDGLPGGSAAVGTISPDGLYRAPGMVPPAGAVLVRATSQRGTYAEARVAIVGEDTPRPAPAPDGGRGSGALPKPSVERTGNRLLVRFRPRRRGRLRVRVSANGARLDSCSARVAAQRAFTCRLKVPKSVASRDIRIKAALYRNGRKLASVRARVLS